MRLGGQADFQGLPLPIQEEASEIHVVPEHPDVLMRQLAPSIQRGHIQDELAILDLQNHDLHDRLRPLGPNSAPLGIDVLKRVPALGKSRLVPPVEDRAQGFIPDPGRR